MPGQSEQIPPNIQLLRREPVPVKSPLSQKYELGQKYEHCPSSDHIERVLATAEGSSCLGAL